jgi:hypothetical protein
MAGEDRGTGIEANIYEFLPRCRRPALTAETIVGDIHEVVFNRILADRTDELPDLADDLLATILMLEVDTHRLSAGIRLPPRPLADA